MDKRLEKFPCRRCGTPAYNLCYVGTKLVCVDCFGRACDAASKRKSAYGTTRLTEGEVNSDER